MELKAGDKAPDFKAKDQDGNTVSLKGYKGRKLVIYFYPEDDTDLCTLQACNIRDNYKELQENGIAVLGVSPDDAASHKAFIKKFSLNFPLVVDTDKKLSEKYGTWGEKNMYGNIVIGMKRYTFLIDEEGIIKQVIKKPKIRDHSAEIIKKFGL